MSDVNDERDIRARLTTYERALNTGDRELAVSCYTDDAIFMPQGSPTFTGTELSEVYGTIFARTKYDIEFIIDELVVVSQTTAYAVTRSGGTLTAFASGEPFTGSNREVFIFGRADGQWKIARYLFNNAPLD